MAYKPIRVGIVSAVDRDAGSARVLFPDLDNLVSDYLPIIKPQKTSWVSGEDLPDVQDHVLVLFTGERTSDGFIVGTYQLEDVDSVYTEDQFGTIYEDGSRVFYDRSTSSLVVESVGNVSISGKNVSVTAENVIITSQNVQINGNLSVSGTITGGGL